MTQVAPIQVFVPTMNIADRIQVISRELGLSNKVACHVANLDDAYVIARSLEKQGVDVFVARRGTAEILKRNLSTPLVHITASLEDMSDALTQARAATGLTQPRIAFVDVPADDHGISKLARLLNFELHIYPSTDEEDCLLSVLGQVRADGMHAVVGGGVILKNAPRFGLAGILLDSGPISLRSAMVKAREIAYASTLEKVQLESFRAIVDNSKDGTLLLDEGQCLRLANPAANQIFGEERLAPGIFIGELLPTLNLRPCYAGVASKDIVLNTQYGTLLVRLAPIKIGDSVQGAIVFLTPANTIAELGAVIHKTAHAKGFSAQYDFSDILGVSPQIQTVKKRAAHYASTTSLLLLVGETGTGKELFAHAIHRASPLGRGPFVTVNCASLPPSLLESELFGYEAGAFTGASRKGKPGLFELANNGTIFLDEISELEIYAQSRLLRVIQEQTTMRIGGDKLIPLNIRIIAATNRNLWALVEEGNLRKDLFFRLNVLSVFIPPLREREGDVEHLLRHALGIKTGAPDEKNFFNKAALGALNAYGWPGNVRELLNVAERLRMEDRSRSLDLECLERILTPQAQWGSLGHNEVSGGAIRQKKDERTMIEEALENNNWHQGNTARCLGMDRTTLYRKMKILGIYKPAISGSSHLG